LHRAAADLTDRQWERLIDHLGRGDPDDEVFIAWPDSHRSSPDLSSGG